MPFEPLWTLSVEQQFYLLFPLLFLFVSRRNFVRIAVGLIVLAPLARMLFSWRLASAGMDPKLYERKSSGAKYVLVPEQYTKPDTSGLKVTVKGGTTTFDIAVP